MEMAKVTSKGQLTLPKKVRDKLKLNAGDNVVFIEKGNGFMIFSESVVEKGEMNLDTGNSNEETQ